jgi:hypothetical protein
MEAVTCSNCRKAFHPVRRSARYCGSTCRKAANRKVCHANSSPHSPSQAPPASQNGSGVHSGRPKPKNVPSTRSTLSVTRRGFVIVPDVKWPGMYRLRCPDGTLTDLINITRARDALPELAHSFEETT